MASVTGMTADAIDELFNDMVIEVRIDDNGQLIYKTKDGTENNGGGIVAPVLAVSAAWPVGSIYISAVPTDPSVLIGAGVWSRFGVGRTLVSQNSGDIDFDLPEEVGGFKSVTLTAEQSGMPAHSHTYSGVTGLKAPLAYFTLTDSATNPETPSSIKRGASTGRVKNELDSSDHNHTYSGTTSSASAPAAVAHPNMPPYIVVYMWKRVS